MGGWSSTVTQGTVIHPETVKKSLAVMQNFVIQFNQYLNTQGLPNISLGYPLGSSAHYQVDSNDTVYGDVDLEIIVEDDPTLSPSQLQSYWHKLEDEFVKTSKPDYVHPDSTLGHPIINLDGDLWVQIDLMVHSKSTADWGRFRGTPQRGLKGLLYGNLFSVLGEMLNMSIQYNGVQVKLRDGIKQPFVTTRKDYELVTLSTDITNFVKDIFLQLAKEQGIDNPVMDPLLEQNPGANTQDIQAVYLIRAIVGLAKSFELNGMYEHGDLVKYTSAEQFIKKFTTQYTSKALVDINSTKRDKAETDQARQRAEQDRRKVQVGLTKVLEIFNESI